MTKFKLKIITPQGIYQEVEIDQINLDTTAGQIGILAHHIPLASGVKVSQMNYIIDGKRTYFSVAGGFIYVNETETTLIANAIGTQIQQQHINPYKLHSPYLIHHDAQIVACPKTDF